MMGCQEMMMFSRRAEAELPPLRQVTQSEQEKSLTRTGCWAECQIDKMHISNFAFKNLLKVHPSNARAWKPGNLSQTFDSCALKKVSFCSLPVGGGEA